MKEKISDNTYNYKKCPNCNSEEVVFKRERVGTQSNSIGYKGCRTSASQTNYRTIGFCKNCGYTFTRNNKQNNKTKNNNLKILLWIFLFPVMFLIWLPKKFYVTDKIKINKETKKIIVFIYILFVLLMIQFS